MGKIESALFFRNTIDRSVFEGPLGGWGRLSRSQGLRVFQRRDRGVDVFAGRKGEFRRALYAPLTKPSTSPFEVVERQTVGTRVKKITRTLHCGMYSAFVLNGRNAPSACCRSFGLWLLYNTLHSCSSSASDCVIVAMA